MDFLITYTSLIAVAGVFAIVGIVVSTVLYLLPFPTALRRASSNVFRLSIGLLFATGITMVLMLLIISQNQSN